MNAAEAREVQNNLELDHNDVELVESLIADNREARELLRYIYEIGGQQFDELRWEWMCYPGCIHGGCEHAAHARYRRLLALLAEP